MEWRWYGAVIVIVIMGGVVVIVVCRAGVKALSLSLSAVLG